MSLNGLDLLRHLASGVVPGAAEAGGVRSPIEGAGFADLLARVREGAVESGGPVGVKPGVGVSLSGEQFRRLSVAIDAAQARGHSTVLALIDGSALTVDVQQREIVAVTALDEARVHDGIDAVITIPAGEADVLKPLFGVEPRRGAIGGPLGDLRFARNPSLAGVLEAALGREQSRNEPAADDAA